jgi:hypothetical protein
VRWQRGLAESVAPNLKFIGAHRSGTVGWIALPFMLVFELFGPLLEVLGYAATVILWSFGLIPLESFLVFLFVSIGVGMLLSINALFLEELSFHLYPKFRQQFRLAFAALLENFGYRQLNSLWRAWAMLGWLFTRKGKWGKIARVGEWQQPDTPAAVTREPGAP